MSELSFSYTIIRSRRKTVAIIVSARGEVTVRAPLRAAPGVIDAFIQLKREWVLRKLDEISRRAARQPVHRFEPGEQFPYQGRFYPLEISGRARPALDLREGVFRLSAAAQGRAAQAFTAWYRARARELLQSRVDELARRYGFAYQKLRVTSARTRWGSCTSRGTLSFSWRVAVLPPDLFDYVVIHELCHLRQHNHSPAFWAEVENILPDMHAHRKALSAWGGQITWD